MFDIGWSELVVIGIVALIAIGPKELPAVLRTVGTYMGKIRRMASEFQGQFQEAMREAEMADLKKQVDDMTDAATKGFTDFDPIGDVRKEVASLTTDPLATPADTTSAAAASPEAVAPATPAPVSSEATIPPPSATTAIAPEAPQPVEDGKSDTAKSDATKPEPAKSGSGA
jgi:sec-independent protein translocase protein TatB